jgi:soluble lytic murein transglycosylase
MAGKHIALTAVLLALPVAGLAQSGLPQARPSTAKVLSAGDHDLFLRAFAAGAKGDWAGAMALGNQGTDTTARQLLQWRYTLDRNSGATFADIDAMMKIAASWPLKGTLQARAEAAISPEMTPQEIVAWFSGRNPNSSLGRVRLGEALAATGQAGKGGPMIARGWAEGSFDDATEQQILAQDSAYLTPQSDLQRLDNLIWRGENSAAQRQVKRVDAKTAALARARILLDGGTRKARRALAAVKGSTDPELLFDWSRTLRLENKDAEAHRMLMRVTPRVLVRDHAARWWSEVNAQARDMLTKHDAAGALALVRHAALSSGEEYVDQQFLAGFIALRFLKQPADALSYFQRLTNAVGRPISKSRGEYWQGRAYEAMGDNASAISHYRLAAGYSETFYGQLAQARIEPEPVLHLKQSDVAASGKAAIEDDALMPQIRVLAELGQAGDLRLFAEAEAASHSAPAHLKAFMQTLTDWGYPEIAVRLAKNASYTGVTMLDFTHPVITLPEYKGASASPDPAMVHGLIRQETEFNPYAVSSAGARGLMQLMSDAARKSARIGHLPYRPEALLSDRDYNVQLGMIEFAGHMDYWDQSIVLAAAGYNAGDTNARRWVAALGDPRNGAVDPVDFIEQIPFSETRNYVQRVLENIEVYRNRLGGTDEPLRIMADLYAPRAAPAVAISAPVAKAN